MRILHVAPCYYPSHGGAQTHLREISNYLAAEGHEVTVATTDALDVAYLWNPNKQRIQKSESIDKAVTIRRFTIEHLPGSPLSYSAAHRALWAMAKGGAPLRVLRRFGRNHPHVPELHQWLKETDQPFDLVAAMNLPYDSILIAAQEFAQRQDIPFVCYPLTHFGSGDQPGSDQESQFYTMRHQVDLVRRSDRLIAQTQFEADFYQSQGMDRQKIAVVGPGVHPERLLEGDAYRFRKKHLLRDAIVLSIGTMTRAKGTIQTVEAIRELWRRKIAVDLVLIGPESDDFAAYWAELPKEVTSVIRKLGFVSDDERRDALAAATVLSMPSVIDSFGMAYLEAWTVGKPVIGANSFAITELIEHRHDGLIVQPDDPIGLADALAWVLENSAESIEMGIRGHVKVTQNHTWRHKCRRVAEIYEEVVGRRRTMDTSTSSAQAGSQTEK